MSAKLRQSFYYVSTIVTGFIGLGLLYGGLSAGLADHVTEVLAGIGGLLGATGPALAGAKVKEQRKDGTFDHTDPVGQVAAGMKAVQDQIEAARSQAEAVKAVVSNVVDDVPVLGPLAADALSKIKF